MKIIDNFITLKCINIYNSVILHTNIPVPKCKKCTSFTLISYKDIIQIIVITTQSIYVGGVKIQSQIIHSLVRKMADIFGKLFVIT